MPDQPAYAYICPECGKHTTYDHAAPVPHWYCTHCGWVQSTNPAFFRSPTS